MKHHKPSILFRDVLFNALLMMMAALIIIYPYINPVALDDTKQPGTLSIEIRWDSDRAVDVDIWMRTPEDQEPVGYRRKEGTVANLLRDDRGVGKDFLDLNYENMYTRGLPDGLYVINIHYYKSHDNPARPIEVLTKYEVKSKEYRVRKGKKVVLEHPKQELTLWRLRVKDGKIISVDEVQEKVAPFR